MASCISRFLCIALFLLALIELGTSLRCYQCKSAFNGECDDPRGKILPDEVCEHSKLVKAFPQTGSKFVCVLHRMVQKDDPNLSVVRGCAPENYCAAFEGSKECQICETDLCNSAPGILVPSIILSIISFLCAKYIF